MIYQEVDGERRIVAGRYAVDGTRATFKIAGYDRSRPLVIDPVLAYATFFGGKEFDYGNGIAVDAQGNAYVVSFFYRSAYRIACAGDFACDFDHPPMGEGDVVIGKLDRDGARLRATKDHQEQADGDGPETGGKELELVEMAPGPPHEDPGDGLQACGRQGDDQHGLEIKHFDQNS